MKHIIFSDIHGNLEALESVASTPQFKEAESILCLGDLVGYGADPNACIEMIRVDDRITTLVGNHDWALFHPDQRRGFNQVAKEALDWTEERITEENLDFIRNLPITHRFSDHFAVHASPYQPDSWHYIFSEKDIERALEAESFHACFVGHTHTPFFYGNDESEPPASEDGALRLQPDLRYLINVGSVGQPRDSDPRASFITFDDESKEVRFFRISYDVESAARKIRDAELPEILADRLTVGQ